LLIKFSRKILAPLEKKLPRVTCLLSTWNLKKSQLHTQAPEEGLFGASFSKPWTINKEASSSAPIISLKSSFELVFALNFCATLDFSVKNASFIGKASSSKKAFTFRFRAKKKGSDAPEVF